MKIRAKDGQDIFEEEETKGQRASRRMELAAEIDQPQHV